VEIGWNCSTGNSPEDLRSETNTRDDTFGRRFHDAKVHSRMATAGLPGLI
jgi:hypothetical protein